MITRYAHGAGLALMLCCEPALAGDMRDCPQIVSNLQRLACFDQAAGTPARLEAQSWSAPEQDAPTVRRVMASEARRAPDDLTFRLSADGNGAPGQVRLLITAPAIASTEPKAYLAISCVQNISRLQLITGQPVDARRVSVRLHSERGATEATPWQVMEAGQVLDAGRGLPAIAQIKQLFAAHRIQVESDHPSFDGLSFDAQGLDPLLGKVRHACRW
ncbi:type VI secretion system-associated protein VasI [Pseudomonas sp. PSKL.D1]|uniref:type VI secretion system-associated protein VasI n=1 Tax=Pseudomonas sp. PSKL.D1 TaxID=3029060 RepID=UPI0023817A16|nr:type VI secretion system-associated protein VasI [Pseudomonas sp. PSKL.D1]WDY59991.1 type VI secretion system-associated protein VasI [Pseudomonas sp. PSKL.D1]